MVKQFSISQLLLALAIAFLAFSLFRFTTHVPEIITVVDKSMTVMDKLNPKIDRIVEEVAQVRTIVSTQTPNILSQVDSALPIVQGVINESEKYSAQLPLLMAELAKIEQQVTLLQASIPDILKRVDDVVKATNNTTKEVSLWRPHSSQYLEEIALSREYIPQYLSRLENTVIDAKTVGSETSSGLVSGFFKGVINLPFEVVDGLTGIVKPDSKSAKNLNAEDITLMQEKTIALLNSSNQTKAIWQNVSSGNRGMIIKGKESTRKGEQCINLIFKNYFSNDSETINQLMCIDEQGLWQVI